MKYKEEDDGKKRGTENRTIRDTKLDEDDG